MKTLTIERTNINGSALDTSLRSAFPKKFDGFTHNGEIVTLLFQDTVTDQELQQAESLVESHAPSKLTPDQQAEVDRKAKLDQARKDVGAVGLDTKAFNSQPVLIQQLAQKIAWLELEITQLKGGTGA